MTRWKRALYHAFYSVQRIALGSRRGITTPPALCILASDYESVCV
jgi:hypothetical protein